MRFSLLALTFVLIVSGSSLVYAGGDACRALEKVNDWYMIFGKPKTKQISALLEDGTFYFQLRKAPTFKAPDIPDGERVKKIVGRFYVPSLNGYLIPDHLRKRAITMARREVFFSKPVLSPDGSQLAYLAWGLEDAMIPRSCLIVQPSKRPPKGRINYRNHIRLLENKRIRDFKWANDSRHIACTTGKSVHVFDLDKKTSASINMSDVRSEYEGLSPTNLTLRPDGKAFTCRMLWIGQTMGSGPLPDPPGNNDLVVGTVGKTITANKRGKLVGFVLGWTKPSAFKSLILYGKKSNGKKSGGF